jgi:hypothetical protein
MKTRSFAVGVAAGIAAAAHFGAAHAQTDWERYVAQPNPVNARSVNSIEYSADAPQPLADHLAVLEKQVLAGEREAVRLAYRVAQTEPVLLPFLYPMIGRLAQARPRVFLEELQRADRREQRELVLTLKAEAPELRARAAALRGATDAPLAALREEAIAALQRRATVLEGLARNALADQVTIVDAWFGRRLIGPCSRPGPSVQGFWNPGYEEIAAAEERLASFLAGTKHCGGTMHPAPRYLRQYVGIFVDGRRRLYLNAFEADSYASMKKIEPNIGDWKTHPYDTCHGGNAFFGAEFDLEQASFANLSCSAAAPTPKEESN